MSLGGPTTSPWGNYWMPADTSKMVGKPIDSGTINALIQWVNLRKRMRAAHDRRECFVKCIFHGKYWPNEPKEPSRK